MLRMAGPAISTGRISTTTTEGAPEPPLSRCARTCVCWKAGAGLILLNACVPRDPRWPTRSAAAAPANHLFPHSPSPRAVPPKSSACTLIAAGQWWALTGIVVQLPAHGRKSLPPGGRRCHGSLTQAATAGASLTIRNWRRRWARFTETIRPVRLRLANRMRLVALPSAESWLA